MTDAQPELQFFLLIDHDNMPGDGPDVHSILVRWFSEILRERSLSAILDVTVCAYGGWFDGFNTSEARFAAADYYQAKSPAVVKVEDHYIRASFRFADELFAKPTSARGGESIRITHTVGARRTKKALAFAKQSFSCSEHGCQIEELRRWTKNSRACAYKNCPHQFADVLQRKQQKQVDVHLAVDLLMLMIDARLRERDFPYVAVVTDDIDLLPAIAAAGVSCRASGRVTLVRNRDQQSYLDGYLAREGVRILTV